jgi:hypothetical protein
MSKPPSLAAANYKEPDFAAVVAKPLTPLQEHFLDWVLEKTEITFPTKKEEAAFAEGVRIGVALRGSHQASPENQERMAEARAAAEAAAAAAEAEAEAEVTPAKAAPAKKTAPAKATKAAPAKATPVTEQKPVKRAPAKKAPPRKAAVATDDEAPF